MAQREDQSPIQRRFKRVPRPKQEMQLEGHDVLISATGRVPSYVSYICGYMNQNDKVNLRATGKAISVSLQVFEIIQRTLRGLYVQMDCSAKCIEEVFTDSANNDAVLTLLRPVPVMNIALSRTPLNDKHPGYAPPYPDEFFDDVKQRTGGRRRVPRYYNNSGYRPRYNGRREHQSNQNQSQQQGSPPQANAPNVAVDQSK